MKDSFSLQHVTMLRFDWVDLEKMLLWQCLMTPEYFYNGGCLLWRDAADDKSFNRRIMSELWSKL